MKHLPNPTRALLYALSLVFYCLLNQSCASNPTNEKGANIAMTTYYIGRFSLAVPTEMEQKLRSSQLRYTEIKEVAWPKAVPSEESRTEEWESFLGKISGTEPPKGKKTIVINRNEAVHGVGKWAKSIFYYYDHFDSVAGKLALLMDHGANGVWIIGETVVEKEIANPKMTPNVSNIARAYKRINFKEAVTRPQNCFFLQEGIIDLPYSEQEESVVRFEGHPLNLSLLIEMYMDFTKEIETTSLITGTRAMLVAALLTPGGSISKIRLRHRTVAGMPGEEAVLRVREGDTKDLLFEWQFNGKDDSGEYPTTHIKMETHDGDLDQKLQIWDAILDSMKPMFRRQN